MSYARRKAPSASRRVAEAGGGARVAREILKSLDEGWDEDADAAWLMEIERRMADFDAGGNPGEEWSVVRDRILAGLRKP